jgi:hypothetical protein
MTAGCLLHAAKEEAHELGERLSKVDTRATAEQTSRAAIRGLTDELAKPEHQRVIDETIAGVSRAAMRGLTEGVRKADIAGMVDRAVTAATASLERRLADGKLQGEVHELGASAVAGVRDELGSVFPDCQGAERSGCVERHIAELSRAAAQSVTDGILGAARLPLLAISFVTGAAFAMLLALLIARTRAVTGPSP